MWVNYHLNALKKLIKLYLENNISTVDFWVLSEGVLLFLSENYSNDIDIRISCKVLLNKLSEFNPDNDDKNVNYLTESKVKNIIHDFEATI